MECGRFAETLFALVSEVGAENGLCLEKTGIAGFEPGPESGVLCQGGTIRDEIFANMIPGITGGERTFFGVLSS